MGVVQKLSVSTAYRWPVSTLFADTGQSEDDRTMTSQQRRTGHVWALIQEWMDAMPYPPSQRKLAQRLDVSPTTVSDWKYGDAFPDPQHMRRLAAELGVPYERVLDAFLKDHDYREGELPKGGEGHERPAAM